MKKLVICLLLLALLLTGCTETAIRCGVDREKNAYVSVTVSSNWSGVDESMISNFKAGFRALADFYREKPDFTVEAQYTDTSGTLTITAARSAATYEEAFAQLRSLLTDEEITPFLQVSTHQENQGEVQSFGLDVTLDMGRILEDLGTEDMPPELQSYFQSALESSSASLALELPATRVVSGPEDTACEGGMAQARRPVSLEGETSLKLATSAVIREGQVVTDAWEASGAGIEEQYRRIRIAAGVLALGAFLLAAVLILGRKKKRPTPEPPRETPAQTE